eukprot:8123916-Alexandrium_andersonii.AAC.1
MPLANQGHSGQCQALFSKIATLESAGKQWKAMESVRNSLRQAVGGRFMRFSAPSGTFRRFP